MNGTKVESRIMARIIALLWVGMLCVSAPTIAVADNVDTNIGEIEQFTATDATFRVNYPQSLYLQSFVCSDDNIQLNWSPGVKTAQAGEVTIGSADSIGSIALFSAWGYYAGGGSGTGSGVATTWDAGYNKGSGLSAVIIGYEADNAVALGSNGGELVISLVDGPPESLPLQVAIISGADKVDWSSPPPATLNGPISTARISLKGLAHGEFAIQVNCAGQQAVAVGVAAHKCMHSVVVRAGGPVGETGQLLNAEANNWAADGDDRKYQPAYTLQYITGGCNKTCQTEKVGTDVQVIAPGAACPA